MSNYKPKYCKQPSSHAKPGQINSQTIKEPAQSDYNAGPYDLLKVPSCCTVQNLDFIAAPLF